MVYGHAPVLEVRWVHNTICLDTGVVFGGRLTALRYPERELVGVPAERQWCAPSNDPSSKDPLFFRHLKRLWAGSRGPSPGPVANSGQRVEKSSRALGSVKFRTGGD